MAFAASLSVLRARAAASTTSSVCRTPYRSARTAVTATATRPKYDDAEEYSTAPRELKFAYGQRDNTRTRSQRGDPSSPNRRREAFGPRSAREREREPARASRRDNLQSYRNALGDYDRRRRAPARARAAEKYDGDRGTSHRSRYQGEDEWGGPRTSRARYQDDDDWGGSRTSRPQLRPRARDDEARERNRAYEGNDDWGEAAARPRRARDDGWGLEDRQARGRRRDAERERDWGAPRAREEMSEVQEALASGDDLVYGLQSVSTALRAGRRRLHTLYAQTGERGTRGANDRLRQQIEADAKAAALRVVRLDRGELNNLSAHRPHQGVVLRCGALLYDVRDTLADPAREDVLLALDEVKDPHNLGALLRTAAYLGARGVVVCAKNSAPLSPAVSRASAGVAEAVPVSSTPSMPRFLRDAAQRGWRVLGADAGDQALNLVDVPVREQPTILVLGSEGEGIRPMVKQCCHNTVRIPRAHNAPRQLDSLNVSVAGGLLLFHLLG